MPWSLCPVPQRLHPWQCSKRCIGMHGKGLQAMIFKRRRCMTTTALISQGCSLHTGNRNLNPLRLLLRSSSLGSSCSSSSSSSHLSHNNKSPNSPCRCHTSSNRRLVRLRLGNRCRCGYQLAALARNQVPTAPGRLSPKRPPHPAGCARAPRQSTRCQVSRRQSHNQALPGSMAS